MAKQANYVRYTIRVPADLYQRLGEAAGEKSINAEIIARLERTLLQDEPRQSLTFNDLFEEVVTQRRLTEAIYEQVVANPKKEKK
jgi:hypothetical protein